jgi:Xaa-Pro aminopeptidase
MKNSILPYDLSLKIVKEKHQQVERLLIELDIDCWTVFARETEVILDPILPFISGSDVVWESAFIFSRKNREYKKVAIVGNFDVDSEKEKGIWDEVLGYTQGISGLLNTYLSNLNPKKIALNYSESDVSADGLSHGLYLKLKRYLTEFSDKFVSAEDIISDLRGIKSETELQLIRNACILTEKINREITQLLKPNMTEIEIQHLYHKKMDELEVKESWQRKSCPAVDTGPGKNFGHVGPTSLRTKKGHTLHNDFGIKLKGYSSDLQRMWFFGKPEEVPQEIRHAFDAVKEAIRLSASKIRPGLKGHEIDKIAREHVVSQGYDEFGHGLGHQVGRATHDGGTLLAPLWERYGNSPKGIIKAGNVFTLELHVKTKNFGMVSLEEMIVITNDGCEFIVPPVEDLIYISQ